MIGRGSEILLCTAIYACFGWSVHADVVVPVRPIRAQMTILATDLILKDEVVDGAFSELKSLVGLEAKVTLYPGRPIHLNDVGPPAIIERNQPISMIFSKFGLSIQTEGRAMQRAGVGERIRVMNSESRTIVSGVVTQSGQVEVGK